MIAVRIQKLVKKFGPMVALNEIDITVEPGELFFLLGPSGCGKTTLLRCLAGFYKPNSGKIFFGDKDVTRKAPHRRKAGMVFQSYALWPHMTVAENVAFGLKQQRMSRPKIEVSVEEALASVQMDGYADRKPNELSGGQQQRVALARALVVRPRCLLLDEPLSNLDARLRYDMRKEIRRICKEHELTAIYVTHDQKEALSIADRIAIMSGGQVEQIGTPQEVYTRPRSQFVADFIGTTNFIPGTVIRTGAGEALVKTELGEFRGVLPEPDKVPADGDAVTLSIRPECWKFDSAPAEENCFLGEIGRAVYYGEVAHYAFFKNGVKLKMSELNPRHLEKHEQKDLYAFTEVEDVVVLSQ